MSVRRITSLKIPPTIRRRLRRPVAFVRSITERLKRPVDADLTSRASYEALYETHAQSEGDDGVGGGEYDIMGEIELDVLRAEGLEANSTLLDFGCGNGRLGVHAVKYLNGGTYLGVDIAPTFLAHAALRLEPLQATGSCSVRLIHQADETFDLADHCVDFACAYSVFTHMEHEDMYRYLVQFKRIIRPGGRLIISCLPLTLEAARNVFLAEATLDPATRWTRVRNVTTSVELVNEIAAISGWKVLRWLPGDQPQAPSHTGEMRAIGQSIVVLTY